MLKKYPFYLKRPVILFGLTLFVVVLFYLKDILVPLSFPLMLAILLTPLPLLLEKWKFPPVPAITIAILVAVLFIAGVAYLLTMEIGSFSDQLPVFKKKLAEMGTKLQQAAS